MSMDHERELDSTRLTRFLTLGLTKEHRPVDEALERLREPDGKEWFRTLIAKSPAASCGPPEEKLAAGTLSLEELKAIKEDAKRLLSKSESKEDRLAALLSYLLSAAAGLAYHRILIVSRSREELDPIFLELTSALPEPWSELFARALRS
jgi:hypothetical protein